MISEEEVLESLDRLGEKLQSLRDENNAFKNKNEQLEKKVEGSLRVIRHIVENTIEQKYEPLVEKLESENKLLSCLEWQV